MVEKIAFAEQRPAKIGHRHVIGLIVLAIVVAAVVALWWSKSASMF